MLHTSFKGAGRVYAGSGTYDGSTWVPDAFSSNQSNIRSGHCWYRIRRRRNEKPFPDERDFNQVLDLLRNDFTKSLPKEEVFVPAEFVLKSNENVYDPLCIICMDRSPLFLFKACGHLCLCGICRKLI